MEDHAEHPACHAHVAERRVIFPQGVIPRYAVSDLGEAIAVGQEVEEGEEDGKGFLHAQEAVKGPFAMVLDDGLEHRRVSRDTAVSDDVLADIIAIGGARPEKETKMECYDAGLSAGAEILGMHLRI